MTVVVAVVVGAALLVVVEVVAGRGKSGLGREVLVGVETVAVSRPEPNMLAVMGFRGGWRGDGSVSTAGLIVRFTVAGGVVLLTLAGLLALVARQAGTEEAMKSAAQTSWVTAHGVVEPRLDPAVLAGQPAALAAFDAAMRRYVLQGSLVRVKVWAGDTIVYSDQPGLVGARFPIDGVRAAALAQQGVASEVSDLGKPENRFEVPYGKLLEVYVGVRATTGQPLLFETYYRYGAVTEAGEAAWRRFAPPSLGALLVLELVQVPFAWSLARRVQRQRQERERLLRHAVEASDAERRRIAGELHDGVVQELTGLTYAMDAARLGPPEKARHPELISNTARGLRTSIQALRSLLVDIYPPNLAEEGLASTLTDLAESMQRHGIQVSLDIQDAEALPPAAAALLFRTCQEIVRNVIAHSNAGHTAISLACHHGIATLIIDDNGCGFDAAELTARADDGHFGLRSLGDLLTRAGGALSVRAAPGQGTRVHAEVPLR
jgi:two-component system, NarL family, sensor kinase